MRNNRILVLVLSMLIAIVLTILPLPEWAQWLRPIWLGLVVIFWVREMPYQFSLLMGWVPGLVLDAMNGTLLGEHALALGLVAYLTLKMHRQLVHFPMWQQLLSVLFMLMCYNGVIFLIQGVIGQPIIHLDFWIAPFTSVLFWPWINVILSGNQRHLRRQAAE